MSASYKIQAAAATALSANAVAQRHNRAQCLRADQAEELMADKIGAKETRAIARLFAHLELKDETRVLLFVLEAMADGRDEFKFSYADLFPMLYKAESAFEMSPTGGRVLKDTARTKLRQRFERLEAEQARCQMTFARVVTDHLDKDDNPIPSCVELFARRYVAEIEVMAEASPGFKRGREDTRARVTAAYVQKLDGSAYRPNDKPRKSAAVVINHNLKAAQGILSKTLTRMRTRGDSEQNCLRALCEILPLELIDFIRSGQAAPTSVMFHDRDMKGVGDDDRAAATDVGSAESQNRPPSETPATQADAADSSAQNSRFVQSPVDFVQPAPSLPPAERSSSSKPDLQLVVNNAAAPTDDDDPACSCGRCLACRSATTRSGAKEALRNVATPPLTRRTRAR